MNRNRAIRLLDTFIRGQFPKTCHNCDKTYFSLYHYLKHTTQMGKPVCFDAELDDFNPLEPLGTLSFANCECGNTMVISSEEMNKLTYWRLFRWAKSASRQTGESVNDILGNLQEALDKNILSRAR